MTYTIHSDKRGFYYKIWLHTCDCSRDILANEAHSRYVTEELAELMAQDWIEQGSYV